MAAPTKTLEKRPLGATAKPSNEQAQHSDNKYQEVEISSHESAAIPWFAQEHR